MKKNTSRRGGRVAPDTTIITDPEGMYTGVPRVGPTSPGKNDVSLPDTSVPQTAVIDGKIYYRMDCPGQPVQDADDL